MASSNFFEPYLGRLIFTQPLTVYKGRFMGKKNNAEISCVLMKIRARFGY